MISYQAFTNPLDLACKLVCAALALDITKFGIKKNYCFVKKLDNNVPC